MKKIIFLCLVFSGCCFCPQPPSYTYQPTRTTYAEIPVWSQAPAPAQRVIRRTVKRTVKIVPESQLKGVIK